MVLGGMVSVGVKCKTFPSLVVNFVAAVPPFHPLHPSGAVARHAAGVQSSDLHCWMSMLALGVCEGFVWFR